MRLSSGTMSMRALPVLLLLLCCCLGYFTVAGCGPSSSGKHAGSVNGGSQTAPVSCPTIESREEWGARPAKSSSPLSGHPLEYAFIHHSGSARNCLTRSSCAAQVKSYQRTHMDENGWDDIGYNFIIGGDGTVFEGRGWDKKGAHTGPANNGRGLGFCLTGNFMNESPTPDQLSALKKLLRCGVEKGKLRSDYKLTGHRDKASTLCPGDKLYSIIQTWSHYSSS